MHLDSSSSISPILYDNLTPPGSPISPARPISYSQLVPNQPLSSHKRRYFDDQSDEQGNARVRKFTAHQRTASCHSEATGEFDEYVDLFEPPLLIPQEVRDRRATIRPLPKPVEIPSLNRNIKTEQFGGHTVQLASPGSVITPKRKVVSDPSIDWPDSFMEVQRNTDGSAKITCPPKWKNLGYLVYMALSEDGRILIGRTEDLEKRLKSYEKELSKGQRSLGKAWLEGKRVIIAPLHLCSSYETARQNETSYIVAKKSEHNRNRGNGDPSISFGSPLSNGGGGKLREDYLKPLAQHYKDTLEPITDLAAAQPKLWCQLRYNKELDYIEVDIPTEWRTLHSAIYVFDVVGKLYIGETGLFGPRISSHLSNTNGHATNSNQKLPTEIRKALKNDLKVALGVLGVCNPTKLRERKVHEARVMLAKETLTSKGGLNKRLEVSPTSSPTSPLRALPSPQPTRPMHTATIRNLRKITCNLLQRIENDAQAAIPIEHSTAAI